MHEFSIAESIRDLTQRLVPAGMRLVRVSVCAGPMRAVDPEVLTVAWQALVRDTDDEGAQLKIDLLPWRLRCGECGREFDAVELAAACSCGSTRTAPSGGDELLVTSLEVDPDRSEQEADR